METLLTPHLFSKRIREDVVFFAEEILGLPLHENQKLWLKNSTRKINILRPGNRWGKSFITAIKHIWHGMTKPNITDGVDSPDSWLEVTYETLNFGPGYEQAREVLRHVVDICEGRVILPQEFWGRYQKTNQSQLKGWAIIKNNAEKQLLPNVDFVTGARLLGRSYSEMGSAFKAKALAYISGDECAEIDELWTFTNVTLLPRLVSMRGKMDFVGTVQPEGYDYLHMIEMAQKDMGKFGKLFYVQKGSMYENEFLDRKTIEETERIADPVIRKQIIEGEYTEVGNMFFGYERVRNAQVNLMEFMKEGVPGRKYVTSVDLAGGKTKWADFTVIQVWDYTEEPYQMVYFFRVQGNEMSIPMQYEKVREVVGKFPGKFLLDGSALGGKNAVAFLSDLRPIAVDIGARVKAEMLSTLKVAFDGYQSEERRRRLVKTEEGDLVDKNPDWGLLRFPSDDLIFKELVNYKLDDKKLRNDIVMTMAQCIWWIEMRRPKMTHHEMIEWDII